MIANVRRPISDPRFTIVLVSMLACAASLNGQPTVQITSPADGAVFSPGQTVTVTVNGSGVSSVFIAGGGPLGYSAPISGPPFQFSIPIPTTITPRQYTLTAMGLGPGQTGASAQITINIQRPDTPVSLRVQPSVLKLNIGQNGYLRVSGSYSDGSAAYLTQAASTTFVSSDPTIATVTNYGIVTAVSSGSATITVNGTTQVPVTVAPAMKIAPLQKALYASQSQQFFPRLANSSVPSVSWSLSPPGVGTVSGTGVYTAPSSITSPQTILLTATDASNDTATATITLLPALAMSMSPSSVNLFASQSAQFSVGFSNTVNSRVNWSIAPSGMGQISVLGLYTAPTSITSMQTVTVTAISTVDGATAAGATINLFPSALSTVTTASNPSAFYSATSQVVTLSAAVTSTAGTVSTGTVTFTVTQGATLIGPPVTSGTVASGTAGANFTLPAGTAPGTYAVQAVYNAGTGFTTSSDSAHTLTVRQIAPTITWSNPASILFGGSLGSGQLNATANVPGTFVYNPPTGTVLLAGNSQTLSVAFTPADAIDYSTATASVLINVTPPPPSGTPDIIVTHTLTRDPSNNNIIAVASFANAGSAAANVQLTIAKVGMTTAQTGLPVPIGAIPAGNVVQTTVVFPASAGATGTATTIALDGTYTGGSFGSTGRITLP